MWTLILAVSLPNVVLHSVQPQDLKGGAKIAPGRMYVKVDHKRDDELGPTLNSGTVGVKLIER